MVASAMGPEWSFPQVYDLKLHLLHLEHFGMQRMKQLAQTEVYWLGIGADIMGLCSIRTSHPNLPTTIHGCFQQSLRVDHAINFLGSHWLVFIDAYFKYPCINPTISMSTRSPTEQLEQEFTHFGYRTHTLVSDNATSFSSEAGVMREALATSQVHHHPTTNGAAERLVQAFKQVLSMSSLPPRAALQEFAMQYRRTLRT